VGINKENLSHYFCGRGLYTFYLKMRIGILYFEMVFFFSGTKGLFWNKWTPYFNLENDFFAVVPV
jgi:hypothetical protein